MTAEQWLLQVIQNGGALGFAGMIIWAILRGEVVPKVYHQAILAQKDAEYARIKERADKLEQLAETVTRTAEHMMQQRVGQGGGL